MLTTSRAWVILATLLIVPVTASAQDFYSASDTTIHLLDIPSPSQPIRCQEDTSDSHRMATRGMRTWEFHVGAPVTNAVPIPPRTIMAAFDSDGTPLMLSDVLSLLLRSGHAAVGFIPGKRSWGHYSEARYDSATVLRMRVAAARGNARGISDAMPAARTRDITPQEEVRARALMRWLWTHRCGVHSGTHS